MIIARSNAHHHFTNCTPFARLPLQVSPFVCLRRAALTHPPSSAPRQRFLDATCTPGTSYELLAPLPPCGGYSAHASLIFASTPPPPKLPLAALEGTLLLLILSRSENARRSRHLSEVGPQTAYSFSSSSVLPSLVVETCMSTGVALASEALGCLRFSWKHLKAKTATTTTTATAPAIIPPMAPSESSSLPVVMAELPSPSVPGDAGGGGDVSGGLGTGGGGGRVCKGSARTWAHV